MWDDRSYKVYPGASHDYKKRWLEHVESLGKVFQNLWSRCETSLSPVQSTNVSTMALWYTINIWILISLKIQKIIKNYKMLIEKIEKTKFANKKKWHLNPNKIANMTFERFHNTKLENIWKSKHKNEKLKIQICISDYQLAPTIVPAHPRNSRCASNQSAPLALIPERSNARGFQALLALREYRKRVKSLCYPTRLIMTPRNADCRAEVIRLTKFIVLMIISLMEHLAPTGRQTFAFRCLFFTDERGLR